MEHRPAVDDNLDNYNHTELYQVARNIGLPAYPSTSIGDLKKLIREEQLEVELVSHPVDEWRHGIMQTLLDHWSSVSPQLRCPAKSGDPRSCFGCIDSQVLMCLVQNKDSEQLFKLRRKPEIPAAAAAKVEKNMSEAKLTIENAPRDAQELVSRQVSRYIYKSLANDLGIEMTPALQETFKNAPLSQVAQTIADALKNYDAQNGKKPARKPTVAAKEEPEEEEEPEAEEEEEEAAKEPARTPSYGRKGRQESAEAAREKFKKAEKAAEDDEALVTNNDLEKKLCELESAIFTSTKRALDANAELIAVGTKVERLEQLNLILMGMVGRVVLHVLGEGAGPDDALQEGKDLADVFEGFLNPPKKEEKPTGKASKKL